MGHTDSVFPFLVAKPYSNTPDVLGVLEIGAKDRLSVELRNMDRFLSRHALFQNLLQEPTLDGGRRFLNSMEKDRLTPAKKWNRDYTAR